jgi:hypothetical protein
MGESPNDRLLEEHRFSRTRDGWALDRVDGLAARGPGLPGNDARKAELLRRLGQWRYWIKRPMSLP